MSITVLAGLRVRKVVGCAVRTANLPFAGLLWCAQRTLRILSCACLRLPGAKWGLMFVVFAATVPAQAFAHSLSTRFGDFYGGLLHPLSSLELGMGFLVLALLAGQQDKRGARLVLAWFIGAMLVGAVLASWLPTLAEQVRLPNLGLAALLGVLVAAAPRIPYFVLPVIGFASGVLSGIGNGLAMAPETAPHLFIPGLAISGLLVVTPLVAFVTTLERHWQLVAVRIVGSWIAASGLLISAFYLRGLVPNLAS